LIAVQQFAMFAAANAMGSSMRPTTAMIYVNSMIEAGSNIQAIGRMGYVIAEPNCTWDDAAVARINDLYDRFGPVCHLKDEIIAYLHHLGRVEFEMT
jgi:hypothetical protein